MPQGGFLEFHLALICSAARQTLPSHEFLLAALSPEAAMSRVCVLLLLAALASAMQTGRSAAAQACKPQRDYHGCREIERALSCKGAAHPLPLQLKLLELEREHQAWIKWVESNGDRFGTDRSWLVRSGEPPGRASTESLRPIVESHTRWFAWANPQFLPGGKKPADMLASAKAEGEPIGVRADLRECDFRGAKFDDLVLPRGILRGARLDDARMGGANLRWASFIDAKLRGARLPYAILADTEFKEADLRGADVNRADLSRATFENARLSDADLTGSCLAGVELIGTRLDGARFGNNSIERMVFEPWPGALPNLIVMAGNPQMTDKRRPCTFAPGEVDRLTMLRTLAFESPHGVWELRRVFREGGADSAARVLTSLLENKEYEKQAKQSLAGHIIAWLGWFVVGMPTDYGANPWLALLLDGGVALLGWLVYLYPAYKGNAIGRHVPNEEKSKDYQPLRGIPGMARALQFSFYTTIQLGWRDFNLRAWVSLLQFEPYEFHVLGWLRWAAGVQALISLWLFAMFLLTYFGHPFD